jgi:hypothetical protein
MQMVHPLSQLQLSLALMKWMQQLCWKYPYITATYPK